jgi:hypothetical protein
MSDDYDRNGPDIGGLKISDAKGSEWSDDEDYFDSSNASGGFSGSHNFDVGGSSSHRDGIQPPPSIPDGARLQFVNIYRAETGKDEDDKPFSIFFLEVSCNTASPSRWTVYRRYTQFRQLNDALRAEGYFVPVLPPKRLIGAFNAEFVKQRKVC